MIFLTAKSDSWFCFKCGSPIALGDDCCGYITSKKGLLLFHIPCFTEWSSNNFMKRYQEWKASNTEDKVKHRTKRKIGRPRIYKSSIQANKIRSSLHYYRKRGNQDKVQELEHMLSNLEIRREHETNAMSSM